MKITIDIPDSALTMIVEHLKDYGDVKITVDEIKANPKLPAFIQSDLEIMYFDEFGDGLHNVDLVEALGLEDRVEDEDED